LFHHSNRHNHRHKQLVTSLLLLPNPHLGTGPWVLFLLFSVISIPGFFEFSPLSLLAVSSSREQGSAAPFHHPAWVSARLCSWALSFSFSPTTLYATPTHVTPRDAPRPSFTLCIDFQPLFPLIFFLHSHNHQLPTPACIRPPPPSSRCVGRQGDNVPPAAMTDQRHPINANTTAPPQPACCALQYPPPPYPSITHRSGVCRLYHGIVSMPLPYTPLYVIHDDDVPFKGHWRTCVDGNMTVVTAFDSTDSA